MASAFGLHVSVLLVSAKLTLEVSGNGRARMESVLHVGLCLDADVKKSMRQEVVLQPCIAGETTAQVTVVPCQMILTRYFRPLSLVFLEMEMLFLLVK